MHHTIPVYTLILIVFIVLSAPANSAKIGDSYPITLPSPVR